MGRSSASLLTALGLAFAACSSSPGTGGTGAGGSGGAPGPSGPPCSEARFAGEDAIVVTGH